MGANDFTDRERKLMALAWQCFDGEPKVNYAKLAELSGMMNTGSAYNAWMKIKKKLMAEGKVTAGGRMSAKRSRSAEDVDGDMELAKKKMKRGKSIDADDEEAGDVKDASDGIEVKQVKVEGA